MRTLLILRGNYFCGQKQWIAANALQDFVIDLEELRFLASGYKRLANGFKSLDYGNESELLRALFGFLQLRLQRGEFCVINAPNANTALLCEYEKLAKKHRYELFIVDFSQSLDECKAKNALIARQSGIFVPEHILDAIDYSLSKDTPPKRFKRLAPNALKSCLYTPSNLNAYKKIHHIGDIQGCYTVLSKALGKLKKDEFYVFLGDYIDRGAENDKVIKWLLKVKDLENVLLLEGNHERHLIKWANGESVNAREFNENTLKDFKRAKITPANARKLCERLKDCFCYEFCGKIVLCSHGGLNFLPQKLENLSFIASDDFVCGVGTYDDSELIARLFCENSPANAFEIFGHRNRKKLPVQIAARVFLCEGKVDAGGFLRIVSLSKNGFECKEFKNSIIRK